MLFHHKFQHKRSYHYYLSIHAIGLEVAADYRHPRKQVMMFPSIERLNWCFWWLRKPISTADRINSYAQPRYIWDTTGYKQKDLLPMIPARTLLSGKL